MFTLFFLSLVPQTHTVQPAAVPSGGHRAPVTRPVTQVFHFVDGAVGHDANPGTQAAPWRTIQKSATSALPGSIVLIAAGVYPERVVVEVSGNASDGPIVFRGAVGGGTILDGSGFNDQDFQQWSGAFGLGLLDITDHSYLRFEHLEIRGLQTSSPNSFLMGVQVAKTQGVGQGMTDIALVGLDVHDIRYTGSQDWGGVQGIAFYGGSTTHAITEVLIQDCEVHDLQLGQSEAMTLNGNIAGFAILDNEVHDNDNIGIVCIGWEGTAGGSWSDDSSDQNAHLYGGHHPLDRARDGVIRGNRVYRCSTDAPIRNPTYPLHDFSAGGIYIDGAKSVVIEGNTVHSNDVGIEVGCEHGGVDTQGAQRSTEDIVVRDNLVYYNGQYGIGVGGYNRFRGVALDCRILNNTVVKNGSLGWGGGQVLLARAQGNLIANNILVARGPSDTVDYDGHANSGQDWAYDHGVVLGSSVGAAHNFQNSLQANLYVAEGGPQALRWKWQMDDAQDHLQGFQGLAALDAAALTGDPLFTLSTFGMSLGIEDYRLATAQSPAVDTGDAGLLDLGTVDHAGLMRIAGITVDRGAHEFGSTSP